MFIIAALIISTSSVFAQPLRKALPVPDTSGENYYAIDSDDPVADPQWHPSYNFVDTTYQQNSWHRIYPGTQSVPISNPQAVCWHGPDSTDNTFAGPIPIGFHFNFYGVNYDSCYLSSNGFVGFGNFARATGSDGPSFSTNPAAVSNGCLPNAALPKAIAAFLMTDGEMVRTLFDSSRAFYRTNATGDSFFISFYNFYHKSNVTTNKTVHKFRADIQIVLASKDSSITFHYRKFYGTVTIGLTVYSAENLFRYGCMPNPCTSNAGVIGVQSDNQTGGTSYLCGGQFTSPGSVSDLHSGLAVKFKRWRNICRVDSIIWPPRNYEMVIGDSIAPVVAFHNLSTTPQTFYTLFRIQNVRTGLILYTMRDSVTLLGPNQSVRITFPHYHTYPQYDEEVGTVMLKAIASPFKNSDQFIGDTWPFDDTLRQTMFVIRRLDNFTDFNNNYTVSSLTPDPIPDVLKWVNLGATVVDGELQTFLPPPRRGLQGDPAGLRLNSPVMKLDRRDITGIEYDRCAFGGITSGGTTPTLGDGGTGDTLISFPINIQNNRFVVLGFSYERSGNHAYPRWYDISTVIGPERTITQYGSNALYRVGDSLEIDFAQPGERANVQSWHEQWSADGGKDFHFERVYLPIDTSYCKTDFRFRVRLKGKNDFEPGNPGDDYDEWFVDNFIVISPMLPEVEVSYVRVGPDWPYERIPASQAIAIPLEVSISNNGGLAVNNFGLVVTITPSGFLSTPYAKLITIPILGPAKTMLISLPEWNARPSGPGNYVVNAYLVPRGYDSESQNDSTYFDFALRFDSSIVYDGGTNDAPVFFQLPGIGIKLQETNPANPVGGSGYGGGSGSIATRFTLYQRDTLFGAQLWLGSFNESPDIIRFVVYKSQGVVPGDTIEGGCATFTTVRSAPWDDWSIYKFPCGPIILDPGEYWLGVSQLGETGLELGVSASRSSCDWICYDPSPNLNHQFVVNYPEMVNHFAYENTALSNSWYPFYFPAGIGKAGFSYYEYNSAYGKKSLDCNKNYNYFHAQGSWIPMIRPYFGLRSFGPPVDDTICVKQSLPPLLSTHAIDFGYQFRCSSPSTMPSDSIKIVDRILCPDPNMHRVDWRIEGTDAYDFVTDSLTTRMFGIGDSGVIHVSFSPQGRGRRTAQLVIHHRATTVPSWDTVQLAATFDDGALESDYYWNQIYLGEVFLGHDTIVTIHVNNPGTIEDTITSVALSGPPADSSIELLPTSFSTIAAGSHQDLSIHFSPRTQYYYASTINIKSTPCDRTLPIYISGIGRVPVAVDRVIVSDAMMKLSPNRPNPFADETTIDFDIAQSGHTRLIITDMLGRVCAVVSDEHLAAGHFSKIFSGKGLAAGMYVCALECNGVVVRRMVDVAR